MAGVFISSDIRVLIVPGLHGSGPGHWQTHWQSQHPAFERVEQADWDNPDLDQWAATIGRALAKSGASTVIAAHSFGCLATAHCLASLLLEDKQKVIAALLVAPADPNRFDLADRLAERRLSCASTVVGSENDPWMSVDAAIRLARTWGSKFISIGAAGHINAQSGLGDWTAGFVMFKDLICQARRWEASAGAM